MRPSEWMLIQLDDVLTKEELRIYKETPGMSVHKGRTMHVHSKKMATCKQGERPQGKANMLTSSS